MACKDGTVHLGNDEFFYCKDGCAIPVSYSSRPIVDKGRIIGAVICFQDTGVGIPDAELPYVFDTFRQVEGTATRVHGGFGLGLSIVKQLVTLMNGEIKVRSIVGEGTTFIVILPLAVPELKKRIGE